jgi:hypothetical protein
MRNNKQRGQQGKNTELDQDRQRIAHRKRQAEQRLRELGVRYREELVAYLEHIKQDLIHSQVSLRALEDTGNLSALLRHSGSQLKIERISEGRYQTKHRIIPFLHTTCRLTGGEWNLHIRTYGQAEESYPTVGLQNGPAHADSPLSGRVVLSLEYGGLGPYVSVDCLRSSGNILLGQDQLALANLIVRLSIEVEIVDNPDYLLNAANTAREMALPIDQENVIL